MVGRTQPRPCRILATPRSTLQSRWAHDCLPDGDQHCTLPGPAPGKRWRACRFFNPYSPRQRSTFVRMAGQKMCLYMGRIGVGTAGPHLILGLSPSPGSDNARRPKRRAACPCGPALCARRWAKHGATSGANARVEGRSVWPRCPGQRSAPRQCGVRWATAASLPADAVVCQWDSGFGHSWDHRVGAAPAVAVAVKHGPPSNLARLPRRRSHRSRLRQPRLSQLHAPHPCLFHRIEGRRPRTGDSCAWNAVPIDGNPRTPDSFTTADHSLWLISSGMSLAPPNWLASGIFSIAY
jgi:hypothetical protein